MTKKIDVSVSKLKGMPLVGWHQPFGTFEYNDEEWEMQIAGGCREIVLKRPDGEQFSISISAVVNELIDDIASLPKGEE